MTLEERIRHLEDRKAIEELRAKYCYYVDQRAYEQWSALFTENARLDFEHVGVFDGRDRIKEFAETFVAVEHPFIVHMLHNPILSVDGDTATGRWYFEAPTVYKNDRAGWIQGRYDDEYRRVDGEWKFASITAEFNYVAYYDDGWKAVTEEDSSWLL